MKILIWPIFLFLVLYAQELKAQTSEYSAAEIPVRLKMQANAVIRDEEIIIDINKLNAVWITHKKIITILNRNGKYDGAVRVSYNKSRPVKSISGALYNSNGVLIRTFKKSDFDDVSTIQDFSLFEDDREKRLLPEGPGYPYTVEYEYKQKYKFTLYLPKWIPVNDDGIAIQKSSFQVSSPTDIPIRYYKQHIQKPVMDSSNKNKINYTWTLKDMSALADEPYSPPFFRSDVPIVIASPTQFEYYGMKGSFHNWQEYGKWSYEHLLKGRDELSKNTINYIQQLTKGISSPNEIAKKIYAYAQQKNRYVSIQIGKGGFEPMKASEVDKVSYGDCKALVNYMMALLKVVDIPSYYTEVYAGHDNISLRPGFASAGQGNHIILCVPFGKDTTWLECTNKYMPFGYLGSFTDNRNVLICTPEGGILTHTPQYPDSVTRQERKAQFIIDSTGNLQGNMATSFNGLLYGRRQPFETLSYADKIKQVKAAYSFMQMDVQKYGLVLIKNKLPVAEEDISFISPRYAAPNENGLSIPLNPVNRFDDIPRIVNNRKNKVYISHGYLMTDTLQYTFPANYKPLLIPQNVDIKNPFGRYTIQIKTGNNKLTYIRTFKLRNGSFPPKSYSQFIDFLQKVSGYDRENFIIAHQ